MISNTIPNEDDSGITVSEVLDILLQRIWLIVAVFVVVTVIGVSYAILATPIYRADALIQVEDNKSSNLGGLQQVASILEVGTSPILGEIEILKSREGIMGAVAATQADLVVTVANRFPIIGNWWARRFGSAAPGQLAKPLFGMDGFAWGGEFLKLGSFLPPPTAFGQEFTVELKSGGEFELRDIDDNVLGSGVVGSSLSFKVGGREGTLSIADASGRPGTEFTLVRIAPVRAYAQMKAQLDIAETGRQSGVIRVTFENANVAFGRNFVNELAKAYLYQNVGRRSAEADQSLKFLEGQLPQIKKNVEAAEDALNRYRNRTKTFSVDRETDVLLQESVGYERNRIELELKKKELAERFQPGHPELRAIDEQLASLSAQTGKIGAAIGRLPDAQKELLRLDRDVRVNTELYTTLLNNAQELGIAKAGTVGNARVIDFAVEDYLPVAPRRSQVALIAALLGFLLGCGAAFLAHALRPTIRSVGELEKVTNLATYATIPESMSQERLDLKRGRGRTKAVEGRIQLLSLISPQDPAIESLRSLRTGLAFAMMDARNNAVVITGPTAELGKSFISANLSVLLAQSGKKILLIESDMRRPQLARYFGNGARPGLSDVLAGSVPFEDALFTTIQPGLDLLSSGQIPPNPGELLYSNRFTELMARVQPDYDYVILDSTPVLPVADSLAVARYAGAVLLVARAEQSTPGEVKDAIKRIESAGGSVRGLIFNGVKRRRVGYGSQYRYYYGYGSNEE